MKTDKILASFFDEDAKEFDNAAAWAAVLMAFEKAKLPPDVALQQARVARILRACDYDFKNKKPILWEPPATGEEELDD